MLALFIRTLLTVLVCEVGSASQFVIAAHASHSSHRLIVWIAGSSALILTSLMAVQMGAFMERIPINPNIISGLIMVIVGLTLLWRSA